MVEVGGRKNVFERLFLMPVPHFGSNFGIVIRAGAPHVL